MADSDDEFDRRNVRDKFHHERNDYDRRDTRRGPSLEDRLGWGNRNRDRREGFREFDRGRRDRFSPARRDGSPPEIKRMRRNWDDGGFRPHFDMPPYGGGPPLHGPPPPGGWGHGTVSDLPPPPQAPYANTTGPRGAEAEFATQPAMMTFKQFLGSQDDNISDEEAMKRYNDYKIDFRKQQIKEFFLQHKDEDWFRSKYHPEAFDKHHDDMQQALKVRCQTFLKLHELDLLSKARVDIDHSYDLVRVLDAAVIFMEGGSEFDLKALDLDCENKETSCAKNSESQSNKNNTETKTPIVISFDKRERKISDDSTDDGETPPKFTEPLKLEAIPPTETPKPTQPLTPVETFPNQNKAPVPTKEIAVKKRNREKSDFNYESLSESESGSLSDSEDESHPAGLTAEKKEGEESSTLEPAEEGEERDEPKPRALHKTLSLFLRNLAPTITKQEVESLCKSYPGFLRVALQDPQPERRFLRRGWVTFDGTVNVKEICWNLNNIRVKDCDMGAIVNRELKQRVRPVSGFTVHRPVAKQDVKHVAKIIQLLDNRWKIWDDLLLNDKNDKEKESFGFVSKNPILKNITEYLVDEGSYEEEALLGEELDEKPKEANPEVFIDRDEPLLRVLDRMILYLRIVHSIDYYSAVEYPGEDEMPHRCGIMHARGNIQPNKITQNDINEWMAGFEMRVAPFLIQKASLDDPEMLKLGKKEPNEEVEKFILANMQELAKDKWLCPLSGKKFKGPEFVRKHILAKHMDRVDEVKQEVAYFNNYLSDPRRPQLPEHPTSRQQLPPPPREAFLPPPPGFPPAPPFPPLGGYRPPMLYPVRRGGPPQFRGPENFRGGNDFRSRDRFLPRRDRARPDHRGAVNYRDLDAPNDADI